MEKLNLTIESGLQVVSLNGVVDITVNPTDPRFLEKLLDAYEELDAVQEEYKTKELATMSPRDVLAFCDEIDGRIREKLDTMFGQEICKPLFGDSSLFALAGGTPLWSNVLWALLDMVDDKIKEERKQTDTKLNKYLTKYRK